MGIEELLADNGIEEEVVETPPGFELNCDESVIGEIQEIWRSRCDV